MHRLSATEETVNAVLEMLALTSLFLVRLGVPIAVTILIAWGLRRLDARWQAEAAAYQASEAVATGALDPTATASPLAAQQPCWELNNCSDAQRAACPACAALDIPCWMARLRADGKLPARCYGCALFRTRPLLQPMQVTA
jgi:hypothetical protein